MSSDMVAAAAVAAANSAPAAAANGIEKAACDAQRQGVGQGDHLGSGLFPGAPENDQAHDAKPDDDRALELVSVH